MAFDYQDYVDRSRYYGVGADDPNSDFSPGSTVDNSVARHITFTMKPKETGATGSTGAAPPQRSPAPQQPQNLYADSPAAQSRLQNIQNVPAGNTVNYGAAAVDHFENPKPVPVYTHWYAGSGGLMGGNNASMDTRYSDRSWNIGAPASSIPGQAQPTLPNINYSAQPHDPTTPPTGWLDRAIAASKAGEKTYSTGATTEEAKSGNLYPIGSVATGSFSPKGDFVANPQGRNFIATPSGGSIGLPTATESAAAKAETAKRANLYNAIQNAQTKADKIQPGYRQSGSTGQEYQGSNLTGEVIQ